MPESKSKSNSSELKKLVATQEWRAKQIESAIANGKKRNIDKRSLGFYESKINELTQLWENFNEAERELQELAFELNETDNCAYIMEDKFADVELRYQDYMADLLDGIKEKSPIVQPQVIPDSEANVAATTTNIIPHTPLPRINLPTFNGDYNNWRSFHDLFVSVVHSNIALQPVQKLHYLKGCLAGEAERLLNHIPITNEDYEPAWEKLKKRYDNKRLLITTQLKKLTNPTRLNNESTKGLQMVIDTTDECLQQLKALGVDVEQWDTLLIHILTQVLPISTIKSWEEELGDTQDLPSLKKFTEFLQTRARVLESVSSNIKEKLPNHITRAYHTTWNEVTTASCPACNENHYVGTCKQFLRMDASKRASCISKSGRCFNCLSSKHKIQQCPNIHTCRICKRKHHTLLHTPQREDKFRKAESSNVKSASLTPRTYREDTTRTKTNTSQTFFAKKDTNVMLSTMRVVTKDRYGKEIILRCLLDSGSQASLITSNAYRRLGLKGKPSAVEICGLNQGKNAWSRYKINLELASCQNKNEKIDVDLLVIEKITDSLPAKSIKSAEQWSHLRGINLADPSYWKVGPIDILLGADVYADILKGDVIKGATDAPIAINTSFGWILLGKYPKAQEIRVFIATTDSIDKLNQNLVKFWEIEEVSKPALLSPEDARSEKHYEETYKRLENGQYQVRLPFIEKPDLGSSREMAMKRFQYLQRKFLHNSQLQTEYSNCLNEYITLGHMKAAPEINPTESNSYYIPHHAVYKESSTTKLRVVFDASAKTTNGKSLNNQLLTGPTLQPKLFATLLKWRKYKVAITADIEKMYRMIQVHPKDQKYQKILWLDPKTNNIQDYEMQTVTFGISSAPYLAIRTLLQLAQDENQRWPLASSVAKTDFYVDDLLTGADTIQEAQELQKQCIEMLKSGNFNLRKWASNYKEMLSGLPLDHIETKDFLQFDDQETVKTLGIQWIPQLDQFTFKVKNSNTIESPTKRKVLSEIASLYDPLGWIAPVVVVAKILMQNLWISGCSWDTKIDQQIETKWQTFKTGLKDLEKLKIPRWIGYTKGIQNIQLHGFSDASMAAYAAVVYLRIQTDSGKTIIHMLTAKTRVAPIKPITIPRLELNGAILLAKLIKSTIKDMQLDAIPITAWTDSMITLQWIKSSPIKWKTYVANRIAEIQEHVPPDCWKHVPTVDNPADIASRGSSVIELMQNNLWWHGPSWLRQPEHEWPATPIKTSQPQLELKRMIVTMISTTNSEELFTKYSSFGKLQRIIALVQRFTYNVKKIHHNKRQGQLTVQEIKEATNTICKYIQRTCFPEEYKALAKRQSISNNSKLKSLTPFLDNEGVIRIGGRLENSTLSYDRKHPIIIPSNHLITDLLIDEIHKYTLHGGKNLVVNTSRNSYWILNAQRTIASRINKCVICIRHRQKTMSQRMGNLPSVRVTVTKPFTNVGIDYAGPIFLKTSPHRNSRQYKGYFCVFVCMATKATHLELVSDLTSTAFLAALKRFIARRGLCSNIYSDCGTNFKGAETILEKDLKKAINEATCEAAKNCILQKSITWHFNPPSAPHFGGIWEANVKSAKYHLRRIIGKSVHTFEEYATLLSQVEACLNSRPLCPIGNGLEDLEVLTPGHFLIGQALIAAPEPNLLQEKYTLTRRWKHIQYMTQQFWNKWSKEYLHTLQQRKKWYQVTPNIKKGEIVIIKEDHTSPTVWPLARVIQTFPGKDNLHRVVELRTATKILTRPLVKICPLPIVNNASEETNDLPQKQH